MTASTTQPSWRGRVHSKEQFHSDDPHRHQRIRRIGRQSLKAILERQAETLEVVAINDLADTKTNAHLFKYDSNYGTLRRRGRRR